MGNDTSTSKKEKNLVYGAAIGVAFGAVFGVLFERIGITFGIAAGIIIGTTIAFVFGDKIVQFFGNASKDDKKEETN